MIELDQLYPLNYYAMNKIIIYTRSLCSYAEIKIKNIVLNYIQ